MAATEQPSSTRWRGIAGRIFTRDPVVDILILFLIVQAVCIIAALLFPKSFRYLSAGNISVMLKAVSVLGIISLGVGILMISGDFDLSIGSNFAFTAIVMTMLVERGLSAFIAAPVALVVGILIGLLNGFITLRFTIPSFIATLGTMLFWRGMTLLVHGPTALRFAPNAAFTSLMSGNFAGIEAAFIWFLAFAIISWLLLNHHKLGNHFFAVGGNLQAAAAIGINSGRVKMLAFAIAGFCAALAGIVATARVGSVMPGQGNGLELQAIAACVIGGLALSGGSGTILGIFLGASMMYTIQDVLLLLRAPGFYLEIFVGILIVVAVILNQVIRQRRR